MVEVLEEDLAGDDSPVFYKYTQQFAAGQFLDTTWLLYLAAAA